jgi:DNA-binding transcriptional LysR family regulator
LISIMEPDRWLGVEIRHLAALQAVAREGSFGRAATRLGYTQSAVSQQIAQLERLVGERLIDRPGGPRAISLTDAGRLLLRHADAIVARLAAAQSDLAALSEGAAGPLRVGIYQSVGARILPRLMRRFSESWPLVEVRLHESADDAELLRLVERADLELTFADLPLDEGPFDSVELLRDPYVLLVAADSPLAERTTAPSLRELSGLPLIGWRSNRDVEEQLRGRVAGLDVVFRTDDNSTLIGLVGAGMGAAVVPRLVVVPSADAVVALPFGTKIPPRLIALAWHRDRYRSAAARAFVETAQDLAVEFALELAA